MTRTNRLGSLTLNKAAFFYEKYIHGPNASCSEPLDLQKEV